MRKKIISLVLMAAMVTTSTLPMTAKAIDTNKDLQTYVVQNEKNEKQEVLNQITKTLSKEGITNKTSQANVELLLVSDGSDITEELEKLNAKVFKASTSIFLVNISAENAYKLAEIGSVKAVGKNKIVSLEDPIKTKLGNFSETNNNDISPQMEYCHELTKIQELWKKGYDGKGIKVAVVDSGLDACNEMFTCTPEGKLKVVDYKDFYWTYPGIDYLGEGDAKLEEALVKTEDTKKYAEYDGKKVYLPDSVGSKVLIGYYNESSYRFKDDYTGEILPVDVNNNGTFDDKFLIAVDRYADNVYGEKFDDKYMDNDKIYIDVNLNGDLSNAKEMCIYREGAKNLKDKIIFKMDGTAPVLDENKKPIVLDEFKEQYNKFFNTFENKKIGKRSEDISYDFVISDVYKKTINNEEGWYINLGFDGNSHGTHVSGEMTGNGYEVLSFVNRDLQPDGTIKGTAKGAELMAMKVGQHDGRGYIIHMMMGLEYAAEHGADVINLSMGGEDDINDGVNDPIAVLIDQLTKKYGVIVSKSAGNSGPRINSTGGGAAGPWSFSVGAYNAAWLNYDYPMVEDSLWYFSSNGPTEDGRFKPDFVSPGSQIGAFPNWHEEKVRAVYNDPNSGTRTVGHGLMQGTSQASPYAGGIVAVLKHAMKENAIPYHPLILQEAIINSGDKTINNSVYRPVEIGGGLIQPINALEYLENLKAKGLTDEGLKDDNGEYTDRNKLYVLPTVNYNEVLEYKPEGLYVRNGDIPESVKVTLKNNKDIDLNLKLTKDSYNYSNEWLRLSENSITIPKGTSKDIELFIDKSKLNKDVNCLNIIMDDESTPLIDGTIPVTVINYLDLTASKPEKSESIERDLPLEQVEKHFVRVPTGTKELKFTVEREDPNEQSRLIVFATDPTGLDNPDLLFVVDGTYNSNTFSVPTKYIVPGTWEVNVYPIRFTIAHKGEEALKQKNRYRFTARINGFIIPSEINFSGKPEEKVNQKIEVSNGANLNAIGYNLVYADPAKNPFFKNEYIEITNGATDQIPFTIEKDDLNYYTNIAITDTEFDADDLDIALYKLGDKEGQKPIEVATSGNSGSKEKISVKELPAGNYVLLVNAYQTAPTTKYKLEMQIVNSSNGTVPIEVAKDTNKPKFGVQNFDVSLTLPEEDMFGYINLIDQKGNKVASSRVNVKVTSPTNASNEKIKVFKDNLPSQFKVGDNAEVTVGFKNIQKDSTQDVTLIVGLYDKNNMLVNVDSKQLTLAPNEIKEITVGEGITIPEGEGYTVKCFIWDNLNNMNSLHPFITIPVK